MIWCWDAGHKDGVAISRILAAKMRVFFSELPSHPNHSEAWWFGWTRWKKCIPLGVCQTTCAGSSSLGMMSMSTQHACTISWRVMLRGTTIQWCLLMLLAGNLIKSFCFPWLSAFQCSVPFLKCITIPRLCLLQAALVVNLQCWKPSDNEKLRFFQIQRPWLYCGVASCQHDKWIQIINGVKFPVAGLWLWCPLHG